MVLIRPFTALRPRSGLAGNLCELPYDVVSAAEARLAAADNPLSFFHVSKPEIDFPPETDPVDPAVYTRGRENFQQLIKRGALIQDPGSRFYLYRQMMGAHQQLGLVAAASCDDYLRHRIKKHELTRPDKEDDRVRHIEALNAQTGPAFLAYAARPVLDRYLAERAAGPPEIDFAAPDGVRHSSWTIGRAEDLARIEAEFAQVPSLYIADGHHRTAAAARVCRARDGGGNSGFFLAVIFPHDQLQILPYHRVLSDLNGMTPETVIERLKSIFAIQTGGGGQPARPRELGLYLAGRWHRLSWRPEFGAGPDRLESLDVTLLQRHVLAPLFGIHDPRTSERIRFVGGIRGARELERSVDRDGCACAFALYPTRIEDLMAIADAGAVMPPKSTWFEPKLRDGMFSHLLE